MPSGFMDVFCTVNQSLILKWQFCVYHLLAGERRKEYEVIESGGTWWYQVFWNKDTDEHSLGHLVSASWDKRP